MEKLATKSGDSNLSSRKDLIRLHKLRSNVDAILVGKKTVSRDNPLLTVRYTKGKNPTRIILDSKGTISNNSKVIQTCNVIPTIIVVSKNITKSNLERLEKLPVEIIIAGETYVSLKLLLKKLYAKKIKKILVEGGGTVHWEFVKNNLFDEMILTVCPFLIGGKESTPFINGTGFSKITESPSLCLKSARRLENHLVLHYIKM